MCEAVEPFGRLKDAQGHRDFLAGGDFGLRIVLSLKLIRAAAKHSRKQTRLDRRQINEIARDPRVKTLRGPKTLSSG